MISVNHQVTLRATMILDEEQLAALDALAGYGDTAFLKVFYEHMGKAYLQPHEKGLRALFANIRTVAGPGLRDCRAMREAMRDLRSKEPEPIVSIDPATPWWLGLLRRKAA